MVSTPIESRIIFSSKDRGSQSNLPHSTYGRTPSTNTQINSSSISYKTYDITLPHNHHPYIYAKQYTWRKGGPKSQSHQDKEHKNRSRRNLRPDTISSRQTIKNSQLKEECLGIQPAGDASPSDKRASQAFKIDNSLKLARAQIILFSNPPERDYTYHRSLHLQKINGHTWPLPQAIWCYEIRDSHKRELATSWIIISHISAIRNPMEVKNPTTHNIADRPQ